MRLNVYVRSTTSECRAEIISTLPNALCHVTCVYISRISSLLRILPPFAILLRIVPSNRECPWDEQRMFLSIRLGGLFDWLGGRLWQMKKTSKLSYMVFLKLVESRFCNRK